MQFRRTVLVALASVAGGVAIAAAAVAFWPGGGSSNKVTTQGQPTVVSAGTGQSSQSSGQPVLNSSCSSAADIYQQLRPSVVEIDTTSTSGGPFGGQNQGEGSGIVLDQQGRILTNNHVAGGADTLEVKFADGTTAPAHLLGSDPGNDLAVIQVDGVTVELKPATLADSSAVHVGDSVLAIGNPFQLEATLTAGIVSGTGRTFNSGNGTRSIQNMIQTDAPVNPGNSGGPLLDCQGKVIGLVTALVNPTGQDVNVGIAFAVPSNTAQRFLSDMIAGQTVSHPWLGIAGENLTPAKAKDLNVSVSSGVYVTFVTSGSPADQAGLHGAFASQNEAQQSASPPPGGDVITEADGQAVSSVQQLASYLDANKKVGDKVELTVVRDSGKTTVTATLAEWPKS